MTLKSGHLIAGLNESAQGETRVFYAQTSRGVVEYVLKNVQSRISHAMINLSAVPKVLQNGFEFIDRSGRPWECTIDRVFIGVPGKNNPEQIKRAKNLIEGVVDIFKKSGFENEIRKIQDPRTLHATLMYRGPQGISFVDKNKLEKSRKKTDEDDDGDSFDGHECARDPMGGVLQESNIHDLYSSASRALGEFMQWDQQQGSPLQFTEGDTFLHPNFHLGNKKEAVFTTAITPPDEDRDRIDALYNALNQAARTAPRTFVPHITLVETKKDPSEALRDKIHQYILRDIQAFGPFLAECKLCLYARVRVWDPRISEIDPESTPPLLEFKQVPLIQIGQNS